jgi:hypothetical protein
VFRESLKRGTDKWGAAKNKKLLKIKAQFVRTPDHRARFVLKER